MRTILGLLSRRGLQSSIVGGSTGCQFGLKLFVNKQICGHGTWQHASNFRLLLLDYWRKQPVCSRWSSGAKTSVHLFAHASNLRSLLLVFRRPTLVHLPTHASNFRLHCWSSGANSFGSLSGVLKQLPFVFADFIAQTTSVHLVCFCWSSVAIAFDGSLEIPSLYPCSFLIRVSLRVFLRCCAYLRGFFCCLPPLCSFIH